MNDKRCECVVRSQRVSAGYILQVEGQAVRYPNAGLERPAITLVGEHRSIRTADMNLDGLCAGSVPTDGGLAYDRVACDPNGIRAGGQRRSDRRTRCVNRCRTNVTLKHIRARICLVLDIYTTARHIIQGYLDRRVSHNEIASEEVTFHSRCEKDTVRVSANGILLAYVPGVYRSRKPHPEV